MADNGCAGTPTPQEKYPLFSLSNWSLFGPADYEKPLVPPPPCIEVFPSEVSPAVNSNVEPVIIDESLSLLKGRVSTFDVFGVVNSDLVPGKYEGGLKLWEGSIDLVKRLYSDVREGRLKLEGKRVLELGCGHGLPGIFSFLKGASTVHFQDFNAEVLRCLTIPNLDANISKRSTDCSTEVRLFAGDWNEIHKLLLTENHSKDQKESDRTIGDEGSDGYDIILMAETVYALSSLGTLYNLVKKCLRRPLGVVYMAGKKHYFGVGGGTRQFIHLIDEDGIMEATLLDGVADGSSNVREVWRLSYK